MNRIYVQTNDAERNEVIAIDRSEDGRLEPLGSFDTGGRGTGKPHLASQSSVVLSDDGAWLLVANAGSDELSLFAVEDNELRPAHRITSGGFVYRWQTQRSMLLGRALGTGQWNPTR